MIRTPVVAPIDGFLDEARQALVPFNVFLAVDIFGYVCWNPDDTHIGQQLEHLVGIVDYLPPMLLDRVCERTQTPAIRVAVTDLTTNEITDGGNHVDRAHSRGDRLQ